MSCRVLFLAFTCLSAGCVSSLPVEEFTLARSAYLSAKEADAAQYAPALWYSAEQCFRDGEKAYKSRRFGEAEYQFNKAKIFAEQAENSARLARQQSGQLSP